MRGPGGQVRRTLKLLWMVFLVLVLIPKKTSCIDEVFPNALRVLTDLPALGFALQSALKNVLTPVFQPQRSIVSGSSRVGEAPGSSEQSPPETYCYGELGCLSLSSDFYHPVNRPINLPPFTRERIQTTFRIFSQEDPKGVVVSGLDVQGALKSSFKPSRKTKVIIHGFLNGKDMPFLEVIPRMMLRHYDINAVWVDWTEGSIALYNRAVANARLVGLEVAHFINFLRDNMGLNTTDVHLIGHSLGAHVCGYAGENIPGLGRITGLDPAEPFFQYMPPIVRLDPTDAKLVDVIHTDSDSIFSIGQGFGLRQPIGHLDFYPNDGRNQPGCTPPLTAPIRWILKGSHFSKIWHVVEDALGCNHVRAAKLFVDSIGTQCPYVAYKCDSYSSYKSGLCMSCGSDGMSCAQMGLHADSWAGVGTGKTGLFFLTTGTEPKFCRYHYEISVELDKLPNNEESRVGQLYVIFLSPKKSKVAFDLTSGQPMTFSARKQYKFFLEHDEDIGKRQEVAVGWRMSPGNNTSSDMSIALSKLLVLNRDMAVSRSRLGSVASSLDAVTYCYGQGHPIIVNNEKVIKVPGSTSCSTSS